MKIRKLFDGLLIMASLLCVALLCSCEKGIDEEERKSQEPGVYDLTVSDVGMFSAKLKAKVTLPEQVGIDFELGFEISESSTFPKEQTKKYKIENYNPDKTFSCELSNLEMDVKYYVRAYMINQMCLYTSQEKTFTTAYKCQKPDELNYVDLGLSVKWATCNVGATKPEEDGDYFAWGETSPKLAYYSTNYKYGINGNDSAGVYNYTKYCTDSEYGYNGFTDNKTTLELSDDAARANWGGHWRMPTREEFDELCNSENCTWTWTTMNGVNGFKVESKKSGYEGNWIFLPANRFEVSEGGHYHGSYWSSSLSINYNNAAWRLGLSDDERTQPGTYDTFRKGGKFVRPVISVPVTGFGIDRQSVETMEGYTETLTAVIMYENGATVKVEDAVWTSSNTAIATVNVNGEVTAVSAGNCTITSTSGSYTATCSVMVKPFEREYVDLGLSVKWANCNVGATKPGDYGDYFAWGETEPKSNYDWSTYKYYEYFFDDYGEVHAGFTKYCTDSEYGYNGFTDNKTTLELSDDAARANWGGRWRMPTLKEFGELCDRDNCTWIWTTMNCVHGYRIVSKKTGYEGNWIFLPAAGNRVGESLNNVGSYYGGYGSYWSSSLYISGSSYKLGFYGDGYNGEYYPIFSAERTYGLSVRPVCPSDSYVMIKK